MKKVLIISNPLAGKGKPIKALSKVTQILQNSDFSIVKYFTISKSDYSGIINAINTNSDIDLLIVSGGDGTLNDVVNSIPEEFKIPIIVLPCGSGNDFATYLYGNKTIDEILRNLQAPKTTNINIGICNGKKFINGLGIGFDGWVAKKAAEGVKYIPPSLKYYTAILRGIFTFRSFNTNLGKALIIAVANGPTYGGGFRIAPEANPTDGFFDLWHIKPIKVLKRALYLDIIKKGKHKNDGITFDFKLLKEIKITCERTVPAHLDGEYLESDIFEVKISPVDLVFVV